MEWSIIFNLTNITWKKFGIVCLSLEFWNHINSFDLYIFRNVTYNLSRLTSSTIVTETFLLLLALFAMLISLMVYSEDRKFVNLIDRGLEVVSEIISEY